MVAEPQTQETPQQPPEPEQASKPKIIDISDKKREAKQLPPNARAFHLSMVDPDTGFNISGEFVIRRLTIGHIREMGIIKAKLCGGMPEDSLDPTVLDLNTMLAQLQVSVVTAPDWWKPQEFFSSDVVFEVFQEVMAFEATFRETLSKK